MLIHTTAHMRSVASIARPHARPAVFWGRLTIGSLALMAGFILSLVQAGPEASPLFPGILPVDNPGHMLVRDFNRDGIDDMAVCHGLGREGADISIFLGTPGGPLRETSVAAHALAIQMLAGDLNADGCIDLVVAADTAV